MTTGNRGGKGKGPIIIREGNVSVRIYTQDRRKQGKGIAYHVADHTTGRRRLRTFSDLMEASAEAKRLARLLSTGQAHAATFSASDAASFGAAVQLLANTGASLEAACALFAESVGIVGSPSLVVEACRAYKITHAGVTPKPVAEAVSEYIATKTAQGASRRYIRDLNYRLGRFAADFSMDLGSVPTPVLQQWLDRQQLAPQGVRNFKVVIGGLYVFGKSRGWCASSPTDGITVSKVRSSKEHAVFTVEELDKLLRAADPEFLPVVVLAALAGLRTSEIMERHWEDINLATGEITIRRGTSKTKSRRIVPLQPAAVAWLAPYAGRTGKVWPYSEDWLFKREESTAKAAGIEWKANGMRAGWASHRLAVLKDVVRVAYEMGNTPDVVHRDYKALVSESAGMAWFAISPEVAANVTAFGQAVGA